MPSLYITVGQSVKSDSNNYYKILEFLGNGANAYAYRSLMGGDRLPRIQYCQPEICDK